MLSAWLNSSWTRVLVAGILTLLIIAVIAILHDPFDFDDRPQIEQLLRLALSNVQSDTAVDMEERLWAQVKMAEQGDLSAAADREWAQQANLFLGRNVGYVGLVLLDNGYHQRRVLELPETRGFAATLDFAHDSHLRDLLQPAESSAGRVATTRTVLSSGRVAYLIAVPERVRGETAGYLIAIVDIAKTLDSLLSEFKGLSFSVAVRDGSMQLYASGGSEHRKEWGQVAKVPVSSFDWEVEVWPKASLLTETTSPFLELIGVFTALLILLLASTVHFGWRLGIKSVALQKTNDQLEHRVSERTAQLRYTNEALRDLSRHVLQLQDEERRRIARELHDSTAQALSGVKINISTVLKQDAVASPAARNLLEESRKMAEQALSEVRTISHLLHPPALEDFGLESAVAWYAAGFSDRSGISTTVKIDPDLGRFSPEIELLLFRIVQEALGNIHRHSGSATAELVLSRAGASVHLVVRDEGCGMPDDVVNSLRGAAPHVGVGIAGMRERVRQFGGALEIASSHQGTALTVVVPLTGLNTSCEQTTEQRET